MQKTLKVLSAILSYPTAELQAAVPEMRAALDAERALPTKDRDWLDRVLEEIATRDLFDLQERYVLLFDRTRSLSLQLFEHVHGESRDRGQAMVDLQQLYEKHGLFTSAKELPDYLPLFLEFLSTLPEKEARELLGEPLHIFEAIRLRLKKRKSAYASVFACLQVLARGKPSKSAVEGMMAAPDPDVHDLEALDAAWEEEEVRFGPDAAQCGVDNLAAKLRAGTRPAPGVTRPERQQTKFTHSISNHSPSTGA
ncbi:MAG: nitrate reductase molybdenum cofactor assembly chaperone [Methyloligellaceae bacterium]